MLTPYPFSATCIVLVFSSFLAGANDAAAQSPGEWQASVWQLWRVNVDGSNLRVLDATAGCRCGSPDWSPDGKQIAYDVLREIGPGYQIAVIDANGQDRRIIGSGSIPTWSPDGKLIACQGGQIQVMNADGSGRETLPGSAHSLRWSPHGNAIVAGIGHHFLLFDLSSGKQRLHFKSPTTISHGYGISPNGRRICFGSPGAGLRVAEVDDQTKLLSIKQVVSGGTAYHASWAPDGKRVAFAWRPRQSELTQIYSLAVDDGEPPKPFAGIDTSHQNVNPDWSPDGKSIVFSCPAPLPSGE